MGLFSKKSEEQKNTIHPKISSEKTITSMTMK